MVCVAQTMSSFLRKVASEREANARRNAFFAYLERIPGNLEPLAERPMDDVAQRALHMNRDAFIIADKPSIASERWAFHLSTEKGSKLCVAIREQDGAVGYCPVWAPRALFDPPSVVCGYFDNDGKRIMLDTAIDIAGQRQARPGWSVLDALLVFISHTLTYGTPQAAGATAPASATHNAQGLQSAAPSKVAQGAATFVLLDYRPYSLLDVRRDVIIRLAVQPSVPYTRVDEYDEYSPEDPLGEEAQVDKYADIPCAVLDSQAMPCASMEPVNIVPNDYNRLRNAHVHPERQIQQQRQQEASNGRGGGRRRSRSRGQPGAGGSGRRGDRPSAGRREEEGRARRSRDRR